jgi:hypothetical protein
MRYMMLSGLATYVSHNPGVANDRSEQCQRASMEGLRKGKVAEDRVSCRGASRDTQRKSYVSPAMALAGELLDALDKLGVTGSSPVPPIKNRWKRAVCVFCFEDAGDAVLTRDSLARSIALGCWGLRDGRANG